MLKANFDTQFLKDIQAAIGGLIGRIEGQDVLVRRELRELAASTVAGVVRDLLPTPRLVITPSKVSEKTRIEIEAFLEETRDSPMTPILVEGDLVDPLTETLTCGLCELTVTAYGAASFVCFNDPNGGGSFPLCGTCDAKGPSAVLAALTPSDDVKSEPPLVCEWCEATVAEYGIDGFTSVEDEYADYNTCGKCYEAGVAAGEIRIGAGGDLAEDLFELGKELTPEDIETHFDASAVSVPGMQFKATTAYVVKNPMPGMEFTVTKAEEVEAPQIPDVAVDIVQAAVAAALSPEPIKVEVTVKVTEPVKPITIDLNLSDPVAEPVEDDEVKLISNTPDYLVQQAEAVMDIGGEPAAQEEEASAAEVESPITMIYDPERDTRPELSTEEAKAQFLAAKPEPAEEPAPVELDQLGLTEDQVMTLKRGELLDRFKQVNKAYRKVINTRSKELFEKTVTVLNAASLRALFAQFVREEVLVNEDYTKDVTYLPPENAEDLLEWLEMYTWIQEDGTTDFSRGRVRPEGLELTEAERAHAFGEEPEGTITLEPGEIADPAAYEKALEDGTIVEIEAAAADLIDTVVEAQPLTAVQKNRIITFVRLSGDKLRDWITPKLAAAGRNPEQITDALKAIKIESGYWSGTTLEMAQELSKFLQNDALTSADPDVRRATELFKSKMDCQLDCVRCPHGPGQASICYTIWDSDPKYRSVTYEMVANDEFLLKLRPPAYWAKFCETGKAEGMVTFPVIVEEPAGIGEVSQ